MEKVDFTQGILAMESDLHRFAYKLTSDRDSANDLVQDCVLHFTFTVTGTPSDHSPYSITWLLFSLYALQ